MSDPIHDYVRKNLEEPSLEIFSDDPKPLCDKKTFLSLTEAICRADQDWRKAFKNHGFTLDVSKGECDELSGPGMLLEQYVAILAKLIGFEYVAVNLKLSKEGTYTQENDVVILHNNQLIVIDCKIGGNIKFDERINKLVNSAKSLSPNPFMLMVNPYKLSSPQKIQALKKQGIEPVIHQGNFPELPISLAKMLHKRVDFAQRVKDSLKTNWNYPWLYETDKTNWEDLQKKLNSAYNTNSSRRWAAIHNGDDTYIVIHQNVMAGVLKDQSFEKVNGFKFAGNETKKISCFKIPAARDDWLKIKHNLLNGNSLTSSHVPTHAKKPKQSRQATTPNTARYGKLLLLDRRRNIGKVLIDEKTETSLLKFPDLFENGDRVRAVFPKGDLSQKPVHMSVENEGWSYGQIILDYEKTKFILSHYPVVRELIQMHTRELPGDAVLKKNEKENLIPVPVRFKLHKECMGNKEKEWQLTAREVEWVEENSADVYRCRNAIFGRLKQPKSSIEKGVISAYKTDKGFGFIKHSSNEKSVFFHISVFQKAYPNQYPEVGDLVCFKSQQNERGLNVVRFEPEDGFEDTYELENSRGSVCCQQGQFRNFLKPRPDRVYYAFTNQKNQACEVFEADPKVRPQAIACVKDKNLHPSLKLPYLKALIEANLGIKKLTPEDLTSQLATTYGQLIKEAKENESMDVAFRLECEFQQLNTNFSRLVDYPAPAQIPQLLFASIQIPEEPRPNKLNWKLQWSEHRSPPSPQAKTSRFNWNLEFKLTKEIASTKPKPNPWKLTFKD